MPESRFFTIVLVAVFGIALVVALALVAPVLLSLLALFLGIGNGIGGN